MTKATAVIVGFFIALAVSQDMAAQLIPTDVPRVRLFEELDYGLPGLAAVEAAVEAGDLSAAKAALLAHFRARPDAQERPKDNRDYDAALADKILVGRFIWGDTVCSYGPDIEAIEWYRVPEGVDWVLFDHELGRHTFVTTLVDAYHNTGDERYAEHLVALLLEFIRDCPVEDGRRMPRIDCADGLAGKTIGVEGLSTTGDPAMMWSQMVAMRRVQRWPGVLQYCIHSPAMTPDALAAILTSMIEHQRYLCDAIPFSGLGNHGTRTTTTVLELAAKLPEFTERDVWIARALPVLLERYNYYGSAHPKGFIYPDGASVEICPNVVSGDYTTLLSAIDWLDMAGRTVPPQLVEIRDKMAEYLAYTTWPSTFGDRRTRPRYVPRIPGRGDLDFLESGGTLGTVPKYASYPMRSGDPYFAGTYFMRSAWSPEAVVLRVRFGPIQYKYSQFGLGDVGDIGVWAYAIHLIPQIYNHPRTGPFAVYGDRSFQGDGRSENTISIDGVGQGKANRTRRAEGPLENPWITTPVFDYVRGSYRFNAKAVKATHTRAVLFLKPDYFVVIDRVDADARGHHYRMKYQFHHELSAEAAGTTVTGKKDGRALIVVAASRDDLALSIVEGQTEPYYEGWHLHGAEEGTPAPALLYEWDEDGSTAVETVIRPVEPGGSGSLEVERRVADGVVTLTVTRDDHVDVVSCGPGHDLTFHRRRRGNLVAAGIVGGTALETDSVTLQPRRPGAAYVERLDGGAWRASSNCDARSTLRDGKMEMVPWDGR